jgi:hypothetical protein
VAALVCGEVCVSVGGADDFWGGCQEDRGYRFTTMRS